MVEFLLTIIGLIPSAIVYYRLFYQVEHKAQSHETRDGSNLLLRRRMGITGAALGIAGMLLLHFGAYFIGGILIMFGYQFALWAIGVRLAILSNNVPEHKSRT